jgi:serine/threonine-protein kinase HipA
MLPEKIRSLMVSIGDAENAGQLLKSSTYEFRYLSPDVGQPSMALLMSPKERLTWQDGDLFPPMDHSLSKRQVLHTQGLRPMSTCALVLPAGQASVYRNSPSLTTAKC